MKIISLSLELTKLQSSKFKTKKGTECLLIPLDQKGLILGAEEKGGRVYLDITVGTKDEKDDYGNDASAWVSQSKEEREAKEDRTFLGNGRVVFDSGNRNPESSEPEKVESVESASDDEDDLPF